MIEIKNQTYETLAEKLLEKIDRSNYFNGSVEADTENEVTKLICTLIVLRERQASQDAAVESIADIVPVWWESYCVTTEGECDNDFSWREFKTFLSGII